ncbi:MAG: FkbM family methyltransferase [Vicinamibacterales bacterium]
MRVISYAQNQEDVVLARLVSRIPIGRFVDVGAGHPILENVTYALYLRGWRGINIEPMEREAALLRDLRPEDTTKQIAAGARPGRLTLFEAPMENRGATTSSRAIVERYEQAGQQFRPFDVDVLPLRSIVGDQDEIHVLKIDVEGMEAEVIAGADLATMRPWVLVIEATFPNTAESSAGAWEPSVVAAGYGPALFDGLNRFYVRADLPEIQALLSVPANVFDAWVPHELSVCRDSLKEAERFAGDLTARLEEATAYAESLRAELDTMAAKAVEREQFAWALQREREDAAPHIEVLRARAAQVEVLAHQLAAMQRELDHAKGELGRLQRERVE